MRSFPTYSVPIFRRSADVNIDNWIYQIETFLRTCGIQEKYRVYFLACRIHTLHFEEIKLYFKKSYPYFVLELRRIFRTSDLTLARLTKLSAMSKDGDEDTMDFIERIRKLTVKIYPT